MGYDSFAPFLRSSQAQQLERKSYRSHDLKKDMKRFADSGREV